MAGKKRWLGASAVTLLALSAAPAWAYILPADAILASVAKQRSKLGVDTLVLQGRYQRGDASARIWQAVDAGKAYRLQVERQGATQVQLTVGTKRWQFPLGGASGAPTRVTDDLVLGFLLPSKADPGGRRGTAFLKRHGIDTKTVTLARQGGRVAYVIGAKPWETDKPQLWVDKDLRAPLRLITVKDGTRREVRYLGLGGELTAEFFPRRIERWENGALVESIEYDKIDVNPKIDADLFAAPR